VFDVKPVMDLVRLTFWNTKNGFDVPCCVSPKFRDDGDTFVEGSLFLVPKKCHVSNAAPPVIHHKPD
jgi:hypothetical protein